MTSIPFVIYRDSPGSGFFSNVFYVLDNIAYARRHGWIPVVDMQRHITLYNEDQVFRGTLNAWEYHFEQPGKMSLEQAISRPHFDNGGRRTGLYTGLVWGPLPEGPHLNALRLQVSGSLQLRPGIVEEAKAGGPLRPDSTIGVHYRGTDMHNKVGHPAPAPISHYVEVTRRRMEELNLNTVFLATDEQDAVRVFVKEFGDAVIVNYRGFIDLAKLDDSLGRGGEIPPIHKAPKPLAIGVSYQRGKEVLLDALRLGMCAHLVAGRSNVAIAALLLGRHESSPSEIAPRGISDGRTGVLPLRYLQRSSVGNRLVNGLAWRLRERAMFYTRHRYAANNR